MRVAVLIALALSLGVSSAVADTTITVTFSYRILKVDEPQEWLRGGFSGSLTLTEGGRTESRLRDGKGLQTNKSRLGATGSDKGSVYRVIDSNAIQATRQFKTHAVVVTARVSGNSCTATVSYTLKPGHDAYVMYSPKYGRELRFRDMRDLQTTCSIK